MKYLFLTIFLYFAALLTAGTIHAQEPIADNSAVLSYAVEANEPDERVQKLQAYFKQHDSPLTAHAEDFVYYADKYEFGSNWALVAAIAGVESTYGKRIPQNSYNAWGWGIPTGSKSGIGFDDWSHGIETVSEGLKNNYMDRGAITLAQIGRIYAPPSATWANKVDYIMKQIENQPLEPALNI